jgi:hypothetical protein
VQYEPIEPGSRAAAEQAAASENAETVAKAVLAVALHDEADWAVAFCERFARHTEAGIRGSALLGFGHLARRFRRLNGECVRPLLEAGLVDPDPWVRGQAESAADDVESFLGWRLRRPG